MPQNILRPNNLLVVPVAINLLSAQQVRKKSVSETEMGVTLEMGTAS